MLLAEGKAPVTPEILTELVDACVLVTSMRGFVTAALCSKSFDQFRALAVNTTGATWIIDTLSITGFHPGAVQMGARWFDVFKTRGGEQIVMVSDNSAVRMAAATLAFAVHVKVSSHRTLAEAYDGAGLKPQVVRPSGYSFPSNSGVR